MHPKPERTTDTLTEKVTPSRVVERRVDRVRDRAQGEGPRDGQLRRRPPVRDVHGLRRRVRRRLRGAGHPAQTIRGRARGNPLAAGVIAFGAGWLISSLLPASRAEQELAEQAKAHATELGRPVADAAKQAATQMRDGLAEPAHHAAESVRATATVRQSTSSA